MIITCSCSGFIYDGVSSEDFGLKIGTFDGGGVQSGTVGLNLNIEQIRIGTNPVPILTSAYYDSVLEFEIHTFFSPDKTVTSGDNRAIKKWLSRTGDYKKLIVQARRFEHYYFMVKVKDIQPILVGDEIAGYKFFFVCDSPFAWEDFSYEAELEGETVTFSIENTSDYEGKLFPTIDYSCTTTGPFSIKNVETGVSMEFSEIYAATTTSIKMPQSIITTTMDNHNFYKYFNRKFLYLLPGVNTLEMTGTGTLTISGRFARMVGE